MMEPMEKNNCDSILGSIHRWSLLVRARKCHRRTMFMGHTWRLFMLALLCHEDDWQHVVMILQNDAFSLVNTFRPDHSIWVNRSMTLRFTSDVFRQRIAERIFVISKASNCCHVVVALFMNFHHINGELVFQSSVFITATVLTMVCF